VPTLVLLLTAAALSTAGHIVSRSGLALGRAHYFLKPLAIALIICVAASAADSSAYAALIVAGLAASAVGDVLLMWSATLFLPGLLAFLAAHLLYSAAFAGAWIEAFGAFRGTWMAPHATGPLIAFTAGAAALAGMAIYRRLRPGIAQGQRPFVVAYTFAIMTMAALATLAAASAWSPPAAAAMAGAWLFVASDIALAMDRFVGSFSKPPLRETAVALPYFSGQALIACSVVLA